MGEVLLDQLSKLKSPLISEVRGKGLFVGVEVSQDAHVDGVDYANLLFKRGLLTKATHQYVLRLAPALIVNEKQIMKAAKITKYALNDLQKLNRERKREARETKSSEKSAKHKTM